MANVYTAGSDRRLIIYSISRYIFLRTAYIDGIERPIMLVSDFLDGLSDVVLGDTIYYAYQNQNGDILVKNVMNNEALFRVKSSENPDMHCPQLVVNKDRLMLFYMVTNPLTDRLSTHWKKVTVLIFLLIVKMLICMKCLECREKHFCM